MLQQQESSRGDDLMERFVSLRASDSDLGVGNRLIEMSRHIPDVIALGRGDPDLPTPAHIVAAAVRAMEAGHTHYTPLGGLDSLREAIAAKLPRVNGREVGPEGEVPIPTGPQGAMRVHVTSPPPLVSDYVLAVTSGQIDLVDSPSRSTLLQRPIAQPLLSIRPGPDSPGIPGNQFIFAPNPATVLHQLLPRYVATRVYQAILETTASEMSSKMVAMKSATENAEELIEDLTLSYNKVRQNNITREMIEIATGARAGR